MSDSGGPLGRTAIDTSRHLTRLEVFCLRFKVCSKFDELELPARDTFALARLFAIFREEAIRADRWLEVECFPCLSSLLAISISYCYQRAMAV
jgi:hypothetical protein